ncbi:MAG: hypothetical protein AAGA30_09470, partial [Planctomycetota bacterium]
MIIGIMATLSLVVVGDAQFNARKSATQSRINLIEQLLAERMENYSVQTPPIDDLQSYADSNPANDRNLAIARQLGRRILLEVLSSEMPRSFGNVALNDLGPNTFPSVLFTNWVAQNGDLFDPGRDTDLIDDLRNSTTFNARIFQRQQSVDPANYPDDSSEYLYQILEVTEVNGQLAIEALGDRAFADSDADGFPEVVDSWGNPIN